MEGVFGQTVIIIYACVMFAMTREGIFQSERIIIMTLTMQIYNSDVSFGSLHSITIPFRFLLR